MLEIAGRQRSPPRLTGPGLPARHSVYHKVVVFFSGAGKPDFACISLRQRDARPQLRHHYFRLSRCTEEGTVTTWVDGHRRRVFQGGRTIGERWIRELRLSASIRLVCGTDSQRVDCPDLLGHGWAPHREIYSIPALAEHLADNLVESYDVIAGVSFGSSVAAALYPLLSTKPTRMVLAEPLLDHPPFPQELIEGAIQGTKDIPTEASILKGNPTWIAAEATLRRMSLTQIDPEAIRQLFEVSLLTDMDVKT